MKQAGRVPTATRAATRPTPPIGPAAAQGMVRTTPAAQSPLSSALALGTRREPAGTPLDPATRRTMESRFGHDFGDVRVHDGATADRAARAADARAFTLGQSIYFAAGQYAPDAIAGRRLLAHELVHTVQQRDAAPRASSTRTVSRPGDPLEIEAERVAAQTAPGPISRAATRHIARQPRSAPDAAPDTPTSTARDDPPPDWAAVAERLRSPDETTAPRAFFAIRDRVLAWDTYAIAVAMLGLRADGKGATWQVMRAFDRLARQNAARFRRILRDLRAGYESVHSATITRSEHDVTITPPQGTSVQSVRQLEDVLGGLIYVAQHLPEARQVAAEWERSARGLARVAALVRALGEARGALVSYLAVPVGHPAHRAGGPTAPPNPLPPAGTTPRFEQTDAEVMFTLRGTSSRLLRYQAVTMVETHASGQSDFAYALEGDLVENVRLVDATLTLVRRVDEMLQGLAEFYGASIDRLEEAKVLRELRSDVLYDLAASALPVAADASERRGVMAARLGDWIGTTADRRLATLRTGVGTLIDTVYQLPGAPSPSATNLPENAPLIDAIAEYGWELTQLLHRLEQLRTDAATVWSGPRDASYLAAVNALERRAGVAAASVPVLNMWGAGIGIYLDLMRSDVGDADDKAEWIAVVMQLRNGAVDYLATSDFAQLDRWVFRSQQNLYRLVDQIRDVRRRENNRRILLAIGALLATAATGGALSGLGAGAISITLGEAAAFTVVTSIATPIALGRTVSGVDVVREFAKSAVTFGVFRVLNVGIVAGAKLLVPQQAFAQFSIVFGGHLVAATGVGALIEYLEHGALPPDLTSFLVSSLVLTTLGALLGAPELMRQLQQGSGPLVSQLHSRILAIRAEAEAIQGMMRDPIVRGRLTEAQFELVKARQAWLSDEMAGALRRLAARDVAGWQRASLGLPEDASAVLNLAKLSQEFGLSIRAQVYPRPALTAGPPPPNEVVGDAIVLANGRYEYNPNMPGTTPHALTTRFRTAGYLVDNEAGVLRLTAPGETTPRYLLLPAGHSMPAPALARLVVAPGPDAADVLRRSQTHSAKGLRMLQAQTAVPSLEGTLTTLAVADADGVRALLVGLGRHVAATDAAALIGVAHALGAGASPRTLAVMMGLGSKEIGAADVQRALGRLATMGTPEFAGLDAIVRLRGDVRSATDRIVGILTRHDEPEAALRSLGVVEPRSESGLDQLVRGLASRDAGLRRQADDALHTGIELVVRTPTSRLRFERTTAGGAQVLTVRDASVTTAKVLRSYTPAELDHLVATTPDIVRIRTLGEGMVQGSAGALFEKWSWRYVLSSQGGISPVARLRVTQSDNGHIHLLAAGGRSSDAFLANPGPGARPGVTDIDVWDMKFYRTGGQIDDEQVADYLAMQKAGFVVNAADGQRYRIRFVNYLFESSAAARANAHAADAGATVWYVDDAGTLTLLP